GEGPNPPIELDGTSQDISLKAQVTMPIFDGFLGKYRFRQLQNAHTMSELKLLAVMEQTINSTVTNYLYAARLQAKLGIEAENMAISLDRLARIRTDATFGTANSIRQLQSLVDLNTDSANYQTTLIDYQSSLRNLNLLMARSSEVQFKVQESIELSETLDYDQLLEEMKISNTQLKLSGSGVDHAMYGMKISESNFLPKLNGYANLSYFDSEDDASFIQQNSVVGPNIGVSLNIPLFTGGANKIQKQNATVALEQQKTSQAQTSLSLETALRNDYSRYEMNKMRLRIERSNLQTFERNYEKTHEDYKLGLVDESDLRTAQLNLLAAKNRINDLTYQVKQSEVNLLQLSGRLAPTNKL
ncbi:MAG: TolC family protein, partial [Cyclobacteriaceae bacterium]|nr:TolC family protein [Cyclobacteriaceae bacterium HetDA_MAG_MS6]